MFYFNIIVLPLYFIFITFIPGYLFLSFVNLRTNLFSLICYSLIISFLINYLIIFSLIVSGLYDNYIIYFYLLFSLFIIYYFRSFLKNYLVNTLNITKKNLRNLLLKFTFEKKIIFILTIFLFFLILQNIYADIKDKDEGLIQIFEMQDVVYQYDHWSKIYFEGILPKTSFLRPHLFPANLSYFYILLGSKFYEFAPLLFLSLIPIYFIFASLSYSIISNNFNFLPAAFLSIVMLYAYTSGQSFSGHLEVPLSLWLFIIFLFLSEFNNLIFKEKKLLVIFFLLLTSCALVKELAWISLGIIVLTFSIYEKKFIFKIYKEILIFIILFLIIFLSFYYFQITKYDLSSNIEFLLKLFTYDSKFYLEDHKFDKDLLSLNTRIIFGLKNIPEIVIIPLIATIFLFNRNKIFKIFILSVYAQIFFWICFTPFYTNYLFLSYFFVFSFGYFVILEYFIKLFKLNNFKYLFFISFLIIVSYSLVNKIENQEDLLQKISKKKVKLNFNNKSYEEINYYFSKNILDGKLSENILTNYPEIYSKDISLFNDVFVYSNNIFDTKQKRPDINYIFLFNTCNFEAFENFNFKIIKKFRSESCLIEIFSNNSS